MIDPNETDIKELEQISSKVVKDYEKTFKDLARYDSGETIETYEKESRVSKYLFFGIPILIALVFIVGEIILSTL